MLDAARTRLREFVRCTRHNLLHLRTSRMSYDGRMWHVRDGDVALRFPYYPYSPVHDIQGYFREGRWRLEPGMTVLDVGGCNGEFALYAAQLVGPRGRVLMLEPDEKNVAVARQMFELNGNPANIEVIPVGLWSKPDRLRFRATGGAESAIDVGGGRGAAAGAGARTGDPDVTEIQVQSLPSLARELDLRRLDFVKMDIEGAEMEAISALPDMPPGLRPRYAIASYHVVDGRRTADVLPEVFARVGYTCETGHTDHLTTWAWPAT
jgi:FkbM family methyltransferase